MYNYVCIIVGETCMNEYTTGNPCKFKHGTDGSFVSNKKVDIISGS
jgi:hypothetical protein